VASVVQRTQIYTKVYVNFYETLENPVTIHLHIVLIYFYFIFQILLSYSYTICIAFRSKCTPHFHHYSFLFFSIIIFFTYLLNKSATLIHMKRIYKIKMLVNLVKFISNPPFHFYYLCIYSCIYKFRLLLLSYSEALYL
jgi:hypothetical protein